MSDYAGWTLEWAARSVLAQDIDVVVWATMDIAIGQWPVPAERDAIAEVDDE
jgi:hypothetical protein